MDILWDVFKCFEFMSYEVLWEQAREVGYPLAVLRMSIGTYQAPRNLLFDNDITQGRSWQGMGSWLGQLMRRLS